MPCLGILYYTRKRTFCLCYEFKTKALTLKIVEYLKTQALRAGWVKGCNIFFSVYNHINSNAIIQRCITNYVLKTILTEGWENVNRKDQSLKNEAQRGKIKAVSRFALFALFY